MHVLHKCGTERVIEIFEGFTKNLKYRIKSAGLNADSCVDIWRTCHFMPFST